MGALSADSALTNGWVSPLTLGVAFLDGLFACNHQGLCLYFVTQWNLRTASDFITPLLDGIGSHDCTPFRSETYAHFGFITPLRLSPHHASIILTQNTYSCSTASPIPTHAESTTIQCAVTYSDMKFAIFELSDMRADGGSSQRVVKGKPLTIPLIYSYLRN